MNENNRIDEGGMNKRNKIYFFASLIFVALIIIGAIVYPLLFTNPKTIFTNLLNDVYSLSNTRKQEDLPHFLGANVSLKMDLSSPNEKENSIFEILNAITFDMDYAFSASEKRLHVQMDSQYQEKDLLNLSMDMDEAKAYFYLQGLYPHYLSVPIEGIKDLYSTNTNVEDTEIVLESIKNALQNSFRDDYFTQEKETILLNETRVKVTKNNLILNQSRFEEILKSLGTELDNDTFITSLARLQNTNEEVIEAYLERMRNNTGSLMEDKEITFSIYTKGIQKKFVGLVIHEELATLSIFKNTDTNYDFEIETQNEQFSGNVDIEKQEKDYTFVISLDTDDVSGSITLNLTRKEEGTIPKIDTANAIAIEDLSIEDQNLIGTNFQNKEGMVKLIQDLISPYKFHLDI